MVGPFVGDQTLSDLLRAFCSFCGPVLETSSSSMHSNIFTSLLYSTSFFVNDHRFQPITKDKSVQYWKKIVQRCEDQQHKLNKKLTWLIPGKLVRNRIFQIKEELFCFSF